MFLGRSMAKAKHMSDETAHAIDEEVRAIVNRNYARARQIFDRQYGYSSRYERCVSENGNH